MCKSGDKNPLSNDPPQVGTRHGLRRGPGSRDPRRLDGAPARQDLVERLGLEGDQEEAGRLDQAL